MRGFTDRDSTKHRTANYSPEVEMEGGHRQANMPTLTYGKTIYGILIAQLEDFQDGIHLRLNI